MATPLFQKGRSKTGGRQKGTPNRVGKTVDDLRAMCEASGVEPFQVFLDLCKSRDEGIRIAAAREASKYLYTQMRSTEISGPNGQPITVQSSEVKELLADFKTVLDTKINERKA